MGVYGAPADMLRVAPDTSVWVNEWGPDRGGCGGLGRFDSRSWTSFLPGSCVLHFDFAQDGAVWVVAQDERSIVGDPGGSGVQTYVITPEAVAATE